MKYIRLSFKRFLLGKILEPIFGLSHSYFFSFIGNEFLMMSDLNPSGCHERHLFTQQALLECF